MTENTPVVKRGRKTKLDEARADKLIKAIKGGNDKKVACQFAGISETTLYRWLEQSKSKNASQELRDFRESFERSEAEAEFAYVTRIAQAASNGRWQAAAWWLERKHPERWAQHTKIQAEISGRDGGAITITVEEARKVVLEMLERGEDNGLIVDGESPEITEG